MKHIKTVLILISICIINTCCQNNNTNKCEVISIDIDSRNKVSFFEIFSRIDIIKLETNENSLINEVSKIVVQNDNYYIFDSKALSVIAFNSKGNFLFRINNQGLGPKQHQKISDFGIYNNKITLLSTMDGTIHFYNLHGNFINRIKLPKVRGAYRFLNFINSDSIALWTTDYENKLKFYSISKNNIFKECIKEPTNNIFYEFKTPVFPYQKFFTRTFDNNVNEITTKCELIPAYKWDFGNLNNNPKIFETKKSYNSDYQLYEFAKKIYSSEVVNYFFGASGGNSMFLYTQIHRKNRNINILYNKKNSKKYVFEKTIEGAYFYPIYWTSEYVIGTIPQSIAKVDEVLPNKILDNKNASIKKLINEFDNPILIKYYFKK